MPKPSKMEVVATDSGDEAFEGSNGATATDMEDDDGMDTPMPPAVQEPFSFSSPSESSSSSLLSVQQLSSSNLQSISGAPGCYHNDKRLGLTIGGNIRIDGQPYLVGISSLMPELNEISSVNSGSSFSSSNPTNETRPRKKRRPSINSSHENSSSSSSSSSSTGLAAKRRRTTQPSASSSSAIQAQNEMHKCTICNSYSSLMRSDLLRHKKTCEKKHNRVIESITAAVNNLPSAEIEKCSNNPQHIDTLVAKIHLEALSIKGISSLLWNFAKQAVNALLLSRINASASFHPPVSSARQLPLSDEMPISHDTSSSSSSPNIKQEPTIKEEENRSEDDMSDEDNDHSQPAPQPQSAGSPWIPFAEQRQVTNVDFPQEIINIPSYLFDEGQVVIGRTVIHDGQEYIILSFSSMQRKRS